MPVMLVLFVAMASFYQYLGTTQHPLDLADNRSYICQTFNGRLGNHIFQYASIYGIAKRHNMTILLGEADDLVQYFKVPSAKVLPDRENVCKGFVARNAQYCCRFEPSFHHLDVNTNYILGEYLQSWKYFSNEFEEVRAELKFQEHIEEAPAFIVSTYRDAYRLRLSSNDVVVIGVHIRRGDLVKIALDNPGDGVHAVPDGYIHRAIDYMLLKYEHPVFIVCSDSMDYARNITNYRNITVQYFHTSPIDDFALLSSTDHVIMTTGTFGWWAGFLSRGSVVYYKYQISEHGVSRNEYDYSEFFPPEWVGIA